MLTIITGASSGLGKCILQRMLDVTECIDWSLETGVDLSDRDSVEAAVNRVLRLRDGPDFLINCAGVNKPEYITNIQDEEWSMQMDTNAKAIWLTAKFLADSMRDGGVICNIISNASHIPMTHSLAYNASKAAAAIMTRQMAKELWQTHGIRVFGVSPNMLSDTNMTKSVAKRIPMLKGITEQEADDYQRMKLITGEATDPHAVAEFVCWLLSSFERHRYILAA